MELYNEYASGVQTGEIITGRLTKLAVQRHLKDLESSGSDDYPYYFDNKEADRVIGFIKKLKHTDGDWFGKPFNLQAWQAFDLSNIFGWRKKEGKTRRFKKGHLEVARKNGKSEELGAVSSYGLLKDGKRGHQVYTAANSKDQAKVVYNIAERMMQMLATDSGIVRDMVGFNYQNVNVKKWNAFLEPLASDSKLLDGRRPSLAVFDEVHEFKDTKLIKVLETGMGNRKEGLIIQITTAGFNMYGPCFQFRKICIDILEGIKHNDYIYANIYTLDEGDDWEDEKNWYKANPNLGHGLELDTLREYYSIAVTEGGRSIIEFKTKHLNIWTTTSEEFISTDTWKASGTAFDRSMLVGRGVFLGLDMSRTKDITALVGYFPPLKGEKDFKSLYWFWCPQDSVVKRSHSDGVPYQDWTDNDLMISIPGGTIDDDWIFDKVLELKNVYNIEQLTYDPRFAYKLIARLQSAGINCVPAQQGYNFYTAPISRLEKQVIDKMFSHNGNEIIQWMNSNVLLKRGSGGGLMIDKEKSTERIDGMSALLMAMGGYLNNEPEIKESVYERRAREGKDIIKVFGE